VGLSWTRSLVTPSLPRPPPAAPPPAGADAGGAAGCPPGEIPPEVQRRRKTRWERRAANELSLNPDVPGALFRGHDRVLGAYTARTGGAQALRMWLTNGRQTERASLSDAALKARARAADAKIARAERRFFRQWVRAHHDVRSEEDIEKAPHPPPRPAPATAAARGPRLACSRAGAQGAEVTPGASEAQVCAENRLMPYSEAILQDDGAVRVRADWLWLSTVDERKLNRPESQWSEDYAELDPWVPPEFAAALNASAAEVLDRSADPAFTRWPKP
jgi:hypothetical protein